jgi:outer membrane receptor protein involved in Fe transport
MNSKVRRFVRLAIIAGSVPAIAGAQQATVAEEDVLEEIVVTAQKREESLRDVPLSVEAVLGDKLADAGIVRLDDLKAYVPNLQMTETGISNNIYVRGIGSGLNQGFEQSVSIYQDGIYHGRSHQSRMPFLDLSRVEVLRGPQPILFGKNAVAGAVSLVSALPTKEFEANARYSYDVENDEQVADLAVSGPFTDSLRGRVALYHRHSDGYIDNPQPTLTESGPHEEPRRNEVAGRVTLAADLSESFTATLRLEAGKFDSDGRQVEIFGETPIPALPSIPASLRGRPYSQAIALLSSTPAAANNVIDHVRSSTGDRSNFDTREVALTLDWQLAGGNTLTSVTGYSKYDLDELCDCDFTGVTLFRAAIQEDYKQVSQEIRLASPTEGRFQWIGGLFFQDYKLDEFDYLYVPTNSIVPVVITPLVGASGAALFRNAANPRNFAQDSTLYSAFLQGTFALNEKWSLTAGGRLSHEKKEGSRSTRLTAGIGGPQIPGTAPGSNPAAPPLNLFAGLLGIIPHDEAGERKETNFSPLLNLQYRASEDSMAYVSLARGYKSGGFDARSNRPVALGGSFQFGQERATTAEVGVKSSLGGKAEVNVAAFYTDYKGLQTSAFDGAIGFNVDNGSAEVRGIEVEGRWRPVGRLLFTGSVAALDFSWKDYQGQCYYDIQLATLRATGTAQRNCDYAGNTNQLAPSFTGFLSAEYSWPIGGLVLTTTADATHTSSFLQSLNLDPVATQEGYTKLNARIALAGEHWELAVVGRNLTDRTTVSYAGDTPLAFRLFQARSYYGFVDPPRSIAVEGRVRF